MESTTEDGGLAAIDTDADGYDELVIDLGDVYGEAPVENGSDETARTASRARSGVDGQRDTEDYRPLDAALSAAQEPLPPAEAWEQFKVPLWCWMLDHVRVQVNEALGELADAIQEDRRPTAAQIRAARDALDDAAALVEDHYADLAPDVEPWGRGAGGTVPYRTMIDQLEQRGYTVERENSGT